MLIKVYIVVLDGYIGKVFQDKGKTEAYLRTINNQDELYYKPVIIERKIEDAT